MPSKNSIKNYDSPAYYHVYNRGAGKQIIFRDDIDKEKFMSILARHLDPSDTAIRADNLPYEKYAVEMIAYCLMDNHFHFLLYQESDPTAITQLLRSVCTSYTMYFNKRHQSSGHLFQGIFKASPISSDAYLAHITRYIHLNPRAFQTYQWSSIGIYLGTRKVSWIHPERVLDMPPKRYLAYLANTPDRDDLIADTNIELKLDI